MLCSLVPRPFRERLGVVIILKAIFHLEVLFCVAICTIGECRNHYMSFWDKHFHCYQHFKFHSPAVVILHPSPLYLCRWGFDGSPKLDLVAKPKVGHREVKLSKVTHWIERKLCDVVDVS